MNSALKRQLACVIVFVALVTPYAFANSAIPAPALTFGAYNTSLGWLWVVSALFACILVEGIVYRLLRLFPMPFLVSIVANIVSAVLALPAALAGAMFDDFLIMPTIMSITLESLVIWAIVSVVRQRNTQAEAKRFYLLPCAAANVLSNFILLVMLAWAQSHYPPPGTAMLECLNNLRQIDSAKEQWATTTRAKDGDMPDVRGVNEYIRGNTTPTCPAGGTYIYGAVGTPPTCTYTNANTNLLHRLKHY